MHVEMMVLRISDTAADGHLRPTSFRLPFNFFVLWIHSSSRSESSFSFHLSEQEGEGGDTSMREKDRQGLKWDRPLVTSTIESETLVPPCASHARCC